MRFGVCRRARLGVRVCVCVCACVCVRVCMHVDANLLHIGMMCAPRDFLFKECRFVQKMQSAVVPCVKLCYVFCSHVQECTLAGNSKPGVILRCCYI
jgi:hypothetical protein